MGVRFFQRQAVDTVNAAEYEDSSYNLKRLGNHQALSLKLATAENRFEELDALFPVKLSGPSTVSQLIRMAERSSLSVTDVQTQPGTEEEVGNNFYRRMSIEIRLQGTLTSLRLFLDELEGGAIPASRIDHLSIDDIKPSMQSNGDPDYTLKIGLILSLFSRNASTIDADSSIAADADAPAPEGGS